MFAVNNLSVQFGERILFKNISFQVTTSDRIGLVGRNGSGKSTLMKILAGINTADSGNIQFPKGTSIGYLEQELNTHSSLSIIQEASRAFDEINELESRINSLQETMARITDYESAQYGELVEELGTLSHHYEMLEGQGREKETELVLKGLGFERADFEKPVNTFSGGWQMRVELAKILLRKPDLLLLDEPTNHLDIESIIWLEGFLSDYPGAVVMVSHDKALLDNLTNRTIEIELGNVYDYKASYSAYIDQRAERIEKLHAEKKNQDRFIEHTEKLIDKFRAKKNKAAFAQTLIRKLERIERVEIEQTDTSSLNLKFPEAPRSGRLVFEVRNLQKSYGDNLVLHDISFDVERGDRIAFVGKNGEGKSTLSRILAGIEDFRGQALAGHNVSIGFYAQHQAEMLDGDITVLESIENLADAAMRPKSRALLGAFLFSGDDVYKKVKVLSGGEKSRLALAILMLKPANVLILDEPTNHLDMVSKNVLHQALRQYPGTLIIVSHDRDFLTELTSKVCEVKGHNIKEYLGDINYFLSKKKIDSMEFLDKKTEQVTTKTVVKPSDHKQAYTQKKQREKDLRKTRKAIQRIEIKIETLEQKIAAMEEDINQPDFYEKASDPMNAFARYDQLKSELAVQMEAWEQLQIDLETIEKSVS